MSKLDPLLLKAFARQSEVLEPEEWDPAEEAYMRWLESGCPVVEGLTPEDAAAIAERPLTVALAAKRERVSTRTVYRWLDSGELQASRAGTKWQITGADLDRRRVESSRPKTRPEPKKKRPTRRKATQAVSGRVWPA